MTAAMSRALAVIVKPKPVESTEPPVTNRGPDLGDTGFRSRHGFDPSADRVKAVPVMGQPTPAVVPAVKPDSTTIGLDEVRTILQGLQETLRLVDSAQTTGWSCGGVDQTTLYQGRILRDRMAAFVSSAKAGDTFEISKTEVDAADKILGCSNEATGATPNKSAYIALGVIVAGAAIFLSVT